MPRNACLFLKCIEYDGSDKNKLCKDVGINCCECDKSARGDVCLSAVWFCGLTYISIEEIRHIYSYPIWKHLAKALGEITDDVLTENNEFKYESSICFQVESFDPQ